MKFTVTMKDPDGVYDSIEEAVRESIKAMGLPEDEAEALTEARTETVKKTTGKFFRYGEYVDIEIDTEAGTATVLPAK